ncbi:MAG: hypothetical protein ACO363_08105, partial [Balneolaceae bacterium]
MTTSFRLVWASTVATLLLLCKQVTGSSFPSFREALDLEYSSVLLQPSVRKHIWHRLDTDLKRSLLADPWDRHDPIEEIINSVCAIVDEDPTAVSIAVEASWKNDPAVYASIRRGLKPIRNADVIVDCVDVVSFYFGIPYDDLEMRVRERYF